jgi:hypothetical protein
MRENPKDSLGRTWAYTRSFMASLGELEKRGGLFANAARDVHALLGRIGFPGDPLKQLAVTDNGESRIKKAVKYQLRGGCRLVTVQDDRCVHLLFTGSHDDTQRWLDRNGGWTAVRNATGAFDETYVSEERSVSPGVVGTTLPPQPLFRGLPSDLFDRLVEGLPRSLARTLEALQPPIEFRALADLTDQIPGPDQRGAVYDVFLQLVHENNRAAEERTRLYIGDGKAVADLTDDEFADVADSDVLRRVPIGSAVFAERVKRFMASASYRDWMLFMRDEQQRVVDEDFAGPSKLTGVSGSGKTCVVVQRAVRLATRYPEGRLLILTLNPSLAGLVRDLTEAVATEDDLRRIDVLPLFELCRRIIIAQDSSAERRLRDVTWRHNETIDQIWRQYYLCKHNNDDALVLEPLHDSLLQRGVSPSNYIREEIEWLRSALPRSRWNDYLTIERKGRAFPLAPEQRRLVLKGTDGWMDIMGVIGAVDVLQIVNETLSLPIRALPQYRCVLVDEAQDFGNLELSLVRRLVAPGENDLFLCGDAAQAVTTKHQNFREVDIDIPAARSRRLSQNYRNSRDILRAAHEVLFANLTDEMVSRPDFEIFDPDLSAFSAATPVLLRARSLDDELAHAVAFARQMLGESCRTACIAVCGYSSHEMRDWAEKVGLPVLSGNVSLEAEPLVVSDLEQTKGFEFDLVWIANASADVLPHPHSLEDEQHRDLARLYVVLTRARRELYVSYADTISRFFEFEKCQEVFAADALEMYSPERATLKPSRPRAIAPEMQVGRVVGAWRNMNGREFLHSRYAIGCRSISRERSGNWWMVPAFAAGPSGRSGA